MSKIDTSIKKCSYVLKRLRDSGYNATKLVGESNQQSLEAEFEATMKNIFHKNKKYTQKDILKELFFIKGDLKKFFGYTPNYSNSDSRVWTILVDGGVSSVFITLYLNSKGSNESFEEDGGDYIEIYDGNQFVRPSRKRIHTLSFEVIAQELNDMGIV